MCAMDEPPSALYPLVYDFCVAQVRRSCRTHTPTTSCPRDNALSSLRALAPLSRGCFVSWCACSSVCLRRR